MTKTEAIEKYQWHNLKENPIDLPTNDDTWIVVESISECLPNPLYATWKGYILYEPSCMVNANITRWKYLDVDN